MEASGVSFFCLVLFGLLFPPTSEDHDRMMYVYRCFDRAASIAFLFFIPVDLLFPVRYESREEGWTVRSEGILDIFFSFLILHVPGWGIGLVGVWKAGFGRDCTGNGIEFRLHARILVCSVALDQLLVMAGVPSAL